MTNFDPLLIADMLRNHGIYRQDAIDEQAALLEASVGQAVTREVFSIELSVVSGTEYCWFGLSHYIEHMPIGPYVYQPEEGK